MSRRDMIFQVSVVLNWTVEMGDRSFRLLVVSVSSWAELFKAGLR